MKYTEAEKTIAKDIGYFYREKNKGNITNALHELRSLNISNISATINWNGSIKDGIKVTITLGRPGLLIGCKGINIEALQNYLAEKQDDKVKIHIVENQLWNYLSSFDYYAYDDGIEY